MVLNLKGKSNDEFARELSFLFSRSIKIRNAGFVISGAGLLIMIFGLCVWLLSLHLYPSILDFNIDVPLSLINSPEGTSKLEVSGIGEEFAGVFTTYAKLLLGVVCILTVSSTVIKIIKGEEIGEILPILLSGGAFLIGFTVLTSVLGSDESDVHSTSPVSVIKRYVKEEKYDKLLTYLNESGFPSSEEASMNYLIVQLHIKRGKPDVRLTQDVVESYMSGVLQANIPVKVRYALEKTALDKTVSQPAISYEQRSVAKSLRYSKASVKCLAVGGLVAFIGLLFVLLGIKIRRRVRFIASH
ncbi:hypothetical protein KNY83_004040 [Salmonella enterica subsp. enterica serovar Mbandaka]|nr:hypothetical protein [Salmonella enterica subsp. enterica serovar Mbandaka]EIM9078594.1 hypothetical protein [Salmonella enterica subsp. enterica serovar Cerro]EGS8854113.1 hypothetical protein [Salmonella enterica subsp. enterica serovar Mbandaka]EGT2272068.1 hypothetical protein [Salmonella enterica subsp. enterica serovar Mbandaka]EGT8114128.1 hypothetical protein [Salmonella enterica subsp. enterica serovar Mbandaka]